MTLVALNAHATGLVVADTPLTSPERVLAAEMAKLAVGVPVVVMVHGKGYCPGVAGRDPHALIFAPRSGYGNSRHVSWPRRLGFTLPGPRDERGLCIALGWNACGSIWQATAAADRAAHMLARLVHLVRRIDPTRRIDLIGHSLGARVILGAVPLLAAGMLGRVLLLAGADFTHRARAALDSPAGASAEFINITTRENDLFDFLFESALAPLGRVRALGAGVAGAANWLDIQIDNPATRRALIGFGLPLAAPQARVCHWSVYLRPGVFRLYRGLIHDRGTLALAPLRAALAAPPQRRWSRLVVTGAGLGRAEAT